MTEESESAEPAEGSIGDVEAPADDANPPPTDNVKAAGRGFLIIAGAKVWFLITGAAVQLGLPIIFDSAKLFGEFKIITEAVSLINMVVVTGTLQAVAKLISETPEHAKRVVTQALKLQLLLGVPIAAAYALGSPWIAERFHDPSLASLMRLSSGIIIAYAFYAIFIGYFNGTKRFVTQASFDIIFATLKTAAILGLVALGFAVTGAVAGFVGAALFIAVASAIWAARVLRGEPEDTGGEPNAAEDKARLKRLAAYLGLIMLYTFALNGLMRADLFVLKSVAGDIPATFAPGAEIVFKVVSDQIAGFYGAVLNIARIPYMGVLAVTFIIFPLISESTFAEDHAKTRAYIRDTFRYCMLFVAAVSLPLLFNSDSLVGALYSADYQAASSALALLSVSIIFFALFVVAATMIIGSGHPVAAVVLMGITFVASAVANWILVRQTHEAVMAKLSYAAPNFPAPESAQAAVANAVHASQNNLDLAAAYVLEAPTYMEWAALATMVAMAVGCVASIAWLKKTFGASPPLGTTIRILVCLVVLWGVDLVFPAPLEWVAAYGKLAFLGIVAAKMTVMGLALIATLAITKEFGKEDVDRVLKVLGRKK